MISRASLGWEFWEIEPSRDQICVTLISGKDAGSKIFKYEIDFKLITKAVAKHIKTQIEYDLSIYTKTG